MFKRLTNFGKICVIAIILAVVGTGLYFAGGKMNVNIPSLGGGSTSSYDAVLLVDTYTGWAPIVWGNGGKEGNEDSYFYKNFGVFDTPNDELERELEQTDIY